jgi:hypothetical protein
MNSSFVPYSVEFRGKSLSPSTRVYCAFIRALVFVFVFADQGD